MSDSDPPKPDISEPEERWRRVLPKARVRQFGLWALLLSFVGLAVALGVLGRDIQLARQDRQIVQKLSQFGPAIVYIDESPVFGLPTRRVASLSFRSENKLGNDDLAQLKGLTRLCSLTLAGSQITDVGLEHIKGLSNLFDLNLSNTQITDVGVAHLRELTSLEYLALENTRVTDAGLEHLTPLTSLTSLNLRDTQVTDAGVDELKKALPNLKVFR